MFAVLLLLFLQFSFWLLFYLFLFSVIYFCFLQKIKKIAQMGRDLTQIIERLPKSTLHATAACPAHKLLTQMREHRHTHTHFAHPISLSLLLLYLSRVYMYSYSICIYTSQT